MNNKNKVFWVWFGTGCLIGTIFSIVLYKILIYFFKVYGVFKQYNG